MCVQCRAGPIAHAGQLGPSAAVGAPGLHSPPALLGPGAAALSPTAALAALLVWSVTPGPERGSPGSRAAVP